MIERSFKKEAFEKCKSNSELTEEQLQSDNAVDLVPKEYSFARRLNPGIVKRVTVTFMIDGDKGSHFRQHGLSQKISSCKV
jgi:hypothetical protein